VKEGDENVLDCDFVLDKEYVIESDAEQENDIVDVDELLDDFDTDGVNVFDEVCEKELEDVVDFVAEEDVVHESDTVVEGVAECVLVRDIVLEDETLEVPEVEKDNVCDGECDIEEPVTDSVGEYDLEHVILDELDAEPVPEIVDEIVGEIEIEDFVEDGVRELDDECEHENVNEDVGELEIDAVQDRDADFDEEAVGVSVRDGEPLLVVEWDAE
jgi:hypothetical protein